MDICISVVDFVEMVFVHIGPSFNSSLTTLNQSHTPVQYRSNWYLSPRQHAIEFIFYLIVYLSICFWSIRYAISHPKWITCLQNAYEQQYTTCDQVIVKNEAKGNAVFPLNRKGKFIHWLLGWATLISYLATVYYRLQSPNCWRLPYLLQPCHTITLAFTYTAWSSSKYANAVFQACTTLTWASVLALLLPDMGDYEYVGDIFNYFYEHILMLVVPVIFIQTGRFEFIGSASWILLGYAIIGLYHATILQFAGLITKVNVATLMSPPEPLKSIGVFYRPVQNCMCFVLHCVYNSILRYLFTTKA